MPESILNAIVNTSIVLVGVLILSNTKYKVSILAIASFVAFVATSFTFNYGFQAGIITLCTVVLIASRFTKDTWEYTLFVLTNVISLTVVSKYWSNFIAHNIINAADLDYEYWYLIISLILQIFIAILIFRIMTRIFKGIGAHLFLETLEREYSRILIFVLFLVQSFYIVVTILPDLLNMHGMEMMIIQTIYTTILTVVTVGLMTLFRYMVKHKIELQEKNASLEQITLVLADVEAELTANRVALIKTQQELEANENLIQQAAQELKEKERLLRFMDKQVATLSETRRKLMDFEHDQLNFIIALDGGIRSGDTAVMRESLEQYGAAVQEVLELKSDSLDLTNLYDSRMMPIRYLILAKAQLAASQGITVTLEVPTQITRIGMDLKDFVRILGIWLDNAIEETIHVDNKWIRMSFILGEDKDENIPILEVRVSNSCRPKQPSDITKLHDQGFSSKEGEGRGNGLRIVRDLMFKHDNIHIETRVKADDDRFTQLLIIALQKQ